MRNMYVKLLLIVLGVGFGIFFGVDLATRGMERIQGSVPAPVDAGVTRVWQTDKQQENKATVKQPAGTQPQSSKQSAPESKAKVEKEPTEPKAEITEATGINRLGNKLGELLQIMAHHGVKWFVTLFDLITG